MTPPASKATAAKKVPPASRRPAAKSAVAKKIPATVKAVRSPAAKKAAKPAARAAAPAAKKTAPTAKKAAVTAKTKKSAAPAKKTMPVAKKSAPAATKSGPAKKAAPVVKGASSSSASAGAAAVAQAAPAPAPARTTFTPKPKPPAPVKPKTGPYAKDLKFLEEVKELLVADRAIYQEQATSLRAEADSLALEREPGDVQFDEESGEGGTVTVDRERNLALSGQAAIAVEEIDYALERIADKTYGYCERCFQPIPKPRLRALPHARLCVACKSGGLSRR
jgi:RNA polymerase-binding transcription factor DksA